MKLTLSAVVAVAAVLLWTLASAVHRLLPGWWGVVWVLAVLAGFVRFGPLAVGRGTSRRRVLRLRAPEAPLAWLLYTAPAFFAFQILLAALLDRMDLLPELPDVAERATVAGPAAALAFALVRISVAPLIEEVYFRGFLLSRLEHAYGPARAIGFTALVFAVVHGSVVLLPYFWLTGVFLGVAVVVTRSLWTGVLLHAGWNAFSVATRLVPELDRLPEIPNVLLVPVLVCSGAIAGFGANRAWKSRSSLRPARPRRRPQEPSGTPQSRA